MKKELRRYHIKKNGIIVSIPLDSDIELPTPNLILSEYNPILQCEVDMSGVLVLVVRKEIRTATKAFELSQDFSPRYYGGYHAKDFNCNGGLILSKKDLKLLWEAMEEDDKVYIVVPDVCEIPIDFKP